MRESRFICNTLEKSTLVKGAMWLKQSSMVLSFEYKGAQITYLLSNMFDIYFVIWQELMYLLALAFFPLRLQFMKLDGQALQF